MFPGERTGRRWRVRLRMSLPACRMPAPTCTAMLNQIEFLLIRLRERLWVKPLIACFLSVLGVLLAHLADGMPVDWKVPDIAQDSVVGLLKIVAASMLGVATFAVASMVSAYASTGQSATARAFPLVVADDVSQNALSVFVGAFIFSIVALSATTNDYFGRAGRFTLFVLTLAALAGVISVFVRWVDSIARLGRLGAVIAKAEQATAQAMRRRRERPCLGGVLASGPPAGLALHAAASGFLQRIDMGALQRSAARHGWRVTLAVLPGSMIVPTRPLGYVLPDGADSGPVEPDALRKAFVIGPLRQFDDDPRFGLVVLAEIAGRALSPGINDPGTAIGILGALHRLFSDWAQPAEEAEPEYDRVAVPALSLDDMFGDVFPVIARDGAGSVEVGLRLQRVLGELGHAGGAPMRIVAARHAAQAMARARRALDFPPDLAQLERRHADYRPHP